MRRFHHVYPEKGRLLFDGGKNNKFEKSIIEDNESPDCANVIFSNGAVETREGYTKLNTAAIGSFAFDGLYTRRANDNSETMVAFAGGTMWQLAATSFTTIPSAQSVFTAGLRVATAQYENHMFIGNGGAIPYKWNGTHFTRHGVYAPVSSVTLTSQNTGLLSGAYRYKISNVNSQSVEGDVGAATTTFTVVSATVRLSDIPVAPTSWGVNSRRIYRTEAGGSTFKRVATIADNTTTTYDDNVADASLGVAAPTDNGVPPNYSVIKYHKDRLFMNDPANPNFVWYTNLGEPYTVASTNFLTCGDSTSDLVKAFGVYDNSLIVYCEKSVWIVYMPSTDPNDWEVVRAKSPYGSKSPFSILDYNNRQLFPAMQNDKFVGFASLAGDTVEPSASLLTISTAGSDLKSDRIEPDMFSVEEAYVPNISGIIFKNKAWLSVTYSSATRNNRVYLMDFSMSNLRKNQQEAWVPFTGINAAQFTIYGGRLYFGSSTANGFVYQLEAGVYSDDGAAIDSYLWTKEFGGSIGEPNVHKDFRYANILLENAGAYFMTVTHKVDSDTGVGDTSQINLNPGGSLWGSMVWGRDSWGGGKELQEYRLYLGSARGKRVQFKFSNQNTAGQRFKVEGLNFYFNMKGDR